MQLGRARLTLGIPKRIILFSTWTYLEYHDPTEVFCKSRAWSLPPIRPYNCEITLLLKATLPTTCMYNLSRPEPAAMETYI